MKTEVVSQVEDIMLKVLENSGIEQSMLTPETNFLKDLGLDSLDVSELVMDLELNLEIDIPDQDFIHFTSFQNAVDYLEKRVAI